MCDDTTSSQRREGWVIVRMKARRTGRRRQRKRSNFQKTDGSFRMSLVLACCLFGKPFRCERTPRALNINCCQATTPPTYPSWVALSAPLRTTSRRQPRCDVCSRDSFEESLLRCHRCISAQHTFCLDTPIVAFPGQKVRALELAAWSPEDFLVVQGATCVDESEFASLELLLFVPGYTVLCMCIILL